MARRAMIPALLSRRFSGPSELRPGTHINSVGGKSQKIQRYACRSHAPYFFIRLFTQNKTPEHYRQYREHTQTNRIPRKKDREASRS